MNIMRKIMKVRGRKENNVSSKEREGNTSRRALERFPS